MEKSPFESPGAGTADHLRRFGRVAPAAVLVGAILVWISWAFNIQWLIHPQAVWPVVTPWTAIWLASLSTAILIQSAQVPKRPMALLSRFITGVIAALGLVVLVEYSRGTSERFDVIWFHSSVTASSATWPGRPSIQMAVSSVALSLLIAFLRVDAKWLRLPLIICVVLSTGPALVAVGGYLFNVPALFTSSGPFGLSLISACGLLLLTGAAVASRPDRPRMAKLLARSDWVSLRRLAIVLAGFPLVIEINRLVFESLGASIQSSWALAVCLATVAAGFGIYQITADQNHAILDRLAMATELASTQDRYRLLAENSTDVIFLTRNGLVDWVSPSVTDVLGGRAEDWIGRVVTSAIHPDDLDLFVAARDSLDTTKPSVFRVRAITESGGHHWVEIHAKRFVGPDGDTDGAIASMSVVDDAVAAEVALDRLARTDVLTGLANRGQALSFLHDHLERPRRPGGDLGVLFYDVDHFKSVNDELGHGAGDLVLTTLSNRITSRTRQGDLVARLGGDEFIVLLVGIHGLDEAATIAEQIRVLATQPIEVDRGSVSSSLSIGVTVAVRGENADELIARADDAMYQAKDSGRNKVVLIPPG